MHRVLERTVTTFNIWNDPYCAAERYLAIAELVSKNEPDIMVFQEVTPDALEILPLNFSATFR